MYDDCKKNCIPDGSSVFTAEAKAIDLALDFVNNCTYTDKFVVFIPPANYVCGRVYCFHVVRKSDRPCVRNVLFL